jgi:hypothetical protein
MTRDEKREQQKEVLFQAGEAKRHLAALKVKAQHLGDLLVRTGHELKTNPGMLTSSAWRELAATHLTSNTGFYKDKLLTDAFNFDALQALAREYEDTQKRVEELERQKEMLGVEDF